MKEMIVFIIAGMVLVSVLFNLKGVEASEYSQGKDIYENKCQMCHGPKGDGKGPAGAAFNPKPANFNDSKFWKQKDVNKIITDTIEHGHGLMPPVSLGTDQIRAVINYISHTFKPKR